MKAANINAERIEEITATTIQVYEKLTELHQDLTLKTRRINALELVLVAAQSDVQIFQQRYEETEKEKRDMKAENKLLKERLIHLESEKSKNIPAIELTAAPIGKEKKSTILDIEQLEKKNLELVTIMLQKDELIKSQQTEIELKNAECTKFKKMSKKYAKSANIISPQAVNNMRFVRKFPILESRCNTLEDKIEKVEKERDMLLLRLTRGSGTHVVPRSPINALNIAKCEEKDALLSCNQSNLCFPNVIPSSSNHIPIANQQNASSIPYSHSPSTNNNSFISMRETSVSNHKPYSTRSYFTPATPEFGLSRAPLKRRSSQELLINLERNKQKYDEFIGRKIRVDPNIQPDVNDPNNYCKSCKRTYCNRRNYRQHLFKFHGLNLEGTKKAK